MPRTKPYKDLNAPVEDWKAVAKKAIYSGSVGAVGAYLLFNETGSSEFLNMSMPSSLAAGSGVAIGSVASDLMSDMIIEKMDQSAGLKQAEGTAVKLAVAGLGSSVALKYGSGVDVSANTFLLGAGSKFIGDGVYEQADPLQMLW